MVTNVAKLLNLLSNFNVTFFIPPFQRNYEWDEELCQMFLDSVLATYESNANGKRDEHFFGNITYYRISTAFGEPSKLVLVDGQQRITTTMLFLIAIKDVCKNRDTKNFIYKNYLINDSVIGNSDVKVKLKQVEADWPVYKSLVYGYTLSGEQKNSALYKNYRFFIGEISKLLSSGDRKSVV